MKRTSLIFRHFIAFFATAFIRMDAAPAATNCSMKYGEEAINSGHPCYLYVGGCRPGAMCKFDDGTQVPVGYQRVNGDDRLLSTDCIGNCDRSLNYNNNTNVCFITQAVDAKPYGQKITENNVTTYRCFCKCPDTNDVDVESTYVCDVYSYGAPETTGTDQCYVTGENQIVSYGAIKGDSKPWTLEKTVSCKNNTYFSRDTSNNHSTCRTCPDLSTCPVDGEDGYQRFICNSDTYEYASKCYICGEHMTCDGGAAVICDSGWYIQLNSSATPLRCDYCQPGWHCADQTGQNPEPNIHLYCLSGYRQVTSTAENAVTLNGDSYICETCSNYEICESGYLKDCKNGWWKSGDTCVACTGNAATCDADGAITCNNGYFPVNKKCEECPDNATCTDNVGFTCNDGYWESGDTCQRCTGDWVATCNENGILTCTDGHFPNNNKCQECPSDAECSNTEFVSCYAGFYGNQNGCTRCPFPGTSNDENNTSITNCYVPIWSGMQPITYTDGIGTFYFDIKSGQSSGQYNDTASYKTSD